MTSGTDRASLRHDERFGSPFPWASVVVVTGLIAAAVVAAHLQRPLSRESSALVIVSRPGGASIRLDGVKRTARTPATVSPVAPGRHEVTLALAGRAPWTCIVDVSPGKARYLEAVLAPKVARWAPSGNQGTKR